MATLLRLSHKIPLTLRTRPRGGHAHRIECRPLWVVRPGTIAITVTLRAFEWLRQPRHERFHVLLDFLRLLAKLREFH
jgi:hypothetical protein